MKQSIIIAKGAPFKIETLIDGNISVQFEQLVKKGDAILCVTPTSKFVCFFNEIRDGQIYYYASYNLSAKIFYTNDWFHYEYVQRIASDMERQKLLEEIDKNGFIWDADTYTLSEKPDKTLLPDIIHIYRINTDDKRCFMGDGLVIGSQHDNKILFVGDDGYGVVDNRESLFERIRCRMIPCAYKDLKCGDTAYKGGNYSDTYRTCFYAKIMKEGHVYLDKGSAIQSYSEDFQWYKIIPV